MDEQKLTGIANELSIVMGKHELSCDEVIFVKGLFVLMTDKALMQKFKLLNLEKNEVF